MAKKIKFALAMKDGVKVRTLNELREHFDLEKIVAYFLDGKLQKWLKDHYYDEEANALQRIDIENLDVSAICEALGVPYADIPLDVDKIQEENKRLEIVKQFTDNEEILSNISNVAFSQGDLERLVAQGKRTIYLCGDTFSISTHWNERTYIGIGTAPHISVKEITDEVPESRISFVNVQVPEQFQVARSKKERFSYKRTDVSYNASPIFDFMLNNSQREYCQNLFDCITEGLGHYKFDLDRGSHKLLEMMKKNLETYKFNSNAF